MAILILGEVWMAKKYSTISFGLVTIPVLFSATVKEDDISFHQYHKKCLERVIYQKYCPHCRKTLKDSEIVKGYEDEGVFVSFDKKELDNLKPENDGEIEIVSFIPLAEVDSRYYDKTYYLYPAKKSKVYSLFLETLKKEKCGALCKVVLFNKFYYALIQSMANYFLLTTLYFASEIKELPEISETKFSKAEMELAHELIKKMKGHFTPTKYKDIYKESVLKAIEAKMAGKKVTKKKRKNKKEIASLMEALEKSLKA